MHRDIAKVVDGDQSADVGFEDFLGEIDERFIERCRYAGDKPLHFVTTSPIAAECDWLEGLPWTRQAVAESRQLLPKVNLAPFIVAAPLRLAGQGVAEFSDLTISPLPQR